jgi:hypothetical protein
MCNPAVTRRQFPLGQPSRVTCVFCFDTEFLVEPGVELVIKAVAEEKDSKKQGHNAANDYADNSVGCQCSFRCGSRRGSRGSGGLC